MQADTKETQVATRPAGHIGWGKILGALVFPLFMAVALPAAYLAAFHQPAPTDMVVQVIGTSAESSQIAAGLDERSGGRIAAEVVADDATARAALSNLDSRAAYDPTTGELLLASAGSAAAAQAATAVFTEVAAETDQTLVITDTAPLPASDRLGVTFIFLGLAAILAGFTTATVLGMALPRLGLRRHLGILGAMSAVTAAIGTWVAYGVYDALGSNLLQVGGMLAALAAVSGLIHLAGMRLIGPGMTIVSIILFVILGVPASGAAVPADMVPGFFSSLQPFLSTSSGLDALRRVIYFDGAGAGAGITTLAAWIVLAAGMIFLASLKQPQAGENVDLLPVKVPADPDQAALFDRRLLAGLLTLPLLFAVVLPMLFVGLFHSPAPHDMSVAVIGSGPAAEKTIAGLEASAGDMLEVRGTATAEQARTMIEELEVRGAVDPASGDVYVASAGGVQASTAAQGVLTEVVESQGGTAHVHDLVALPAKDAVGASALYLGIGAMVGGFLAAVIVGLLGAGLRTSTRALLVTGVSLVSAAIQVMWGWAVFDVFEGNAMSAFAVLASLAVTLGLLTLAGFAFIGPAQILVTVFGFLILGVATSGVAVQLDLASGFYSVVHAFLPTAQGLGGIRDAIYFSGADLTSNHLVMAAWLALAVVGLVWSSRRTTPVVVAEDGVPASAALGDSAEEHLVDH